MDFDLSTEAEEPPTEQPFFGIEAAPSFAPSAEEIGEIALYIGQELYDEARERVESLASRFAGDADIEARRAKIDAALASSKAAPGQPSSLSRDEIESELLSAIPDDEEE